MSRKLVFSFWADIASDIAVDTLKELEIPYTVKTKRRLREKSLREKFYDEWVEIYVDEKDLIEWVKKKIEDKINGYN
jgi:hypothetical protein